MQIMQYRQNELQRALDGLRETGVPLVSMNESALQPSGNGDDAGLYYFVPKLAQAFDLTIPLSLDLFYYTLLALAFTLGAVGIGLCFRTWAARATAWAWLCSILCLVSVWNDVYLIAPCLVMGFVPLLFWVFQSPRGKALLITIGFALGVMVSSGNLLRSHAGTGVLLIGLVMGITAVGIDWRRRAYFVVALAIGFAGPQFYFHYLVHQRDAYLAEHVPNYRPGGVKHAFWHPVYLGLGFLPNPYGLAWDDSVAMKAADAASPGVIYLSPEYSQALKKLVFELHGKDRVFVYRTIFAKAGIIGYYLLRYAGVGLIAGWIRPKGWRVDLAMAVGLGFSALPGVIAIPDEIYLVGFMALASMYSAMSVGRLVDAAVLELPASRMMTWPALASRPGARKAICWSTSLVVIVIAGRIADKKIDRTWTTLARFVGQSVADSHLDEILELAAQSSFSDVLESDEIPFKTTNAQVQLTREGDELCLTSDSVLYGYQAEAPLDLTGADGLYVRYEIEVLEGAVSLGILDSSGHWAKVANCTGPGEYRDVLAAYLANDPHVKLVISNCNRSAPSRCRFRELNVGICSAKKGSPAVAQAETTRR